MSPTQRYEAAHSKQGVGSLLAHKRIRVAHVSSSFFQLSFAVRKWPDCGENCSTVFQRKVRSSAEVPPPSLSASGAGAEAYVPAARSNVFNCLWLLLFILLCACAHVSVCMHTWGCAHMEARGGHQEPSCIAIHLVFETRSLSESGTYYLSWAS